MQCVEHIPVSAIDRSDTGFKISRADDNHVSALAGSMAEAGLSMPLLVFPKNEGFGLVSGFRRFEAAVALGWETVACRVARETDLKNLARQAVIENAFQRDLGPGELLRAVKLLGQYMAPKDIAEQAPALLNTRLNSGYIGGLSRILDLPDAVLDLLDNGHLGLKAAKLLTQTDHGNASSLIDLLARVNVSSSKQMEIITWAKEVCAREGIPVSELVTDEEIQAIISGTGTPSESKGHHDAAALGNRLRLRLFQLRFPNLDAAKKASLKALQSLKLQKGMRLELPENFEGMVYALRFEFKTSEEFEARAAAVNELIGQEQFKGLLTR